MRSFIQLTLVLMFVAILGSNAAVSPGFKARITDKGLKYANTVAMTALHQSMLNVKIPDQSGKEAGVKYSVTNIRVTSFNPPSGDISTAPGKGLIWKASGASLSLHADFSFRKNSVLKTSGNFDATISGVTFDLEFSIGADGNGRPKVATTNCGSSIDSVNIKFHGGLAVLLNLLRKPIEKSLKGLLNKQMCPLIRKVVDVDGAKKLDKLKVNVTLGKDYLLDYRVIKNPVFTPDYLETFHKGEIYWMAAQAESPIPVPPMPDTADSNHMMFLWVSDYMCNTMMYNAQLHKALMYNLTRKDLPPDQQGVLNATCEGFLPKCVGKLIPGIGEKYPNSIVEMHMNSTKMPLMKISKSGISMDFEGLIDMYANVTDKPLAYLLTLDAKMAVTVNVSVENLLLYAQINDLRVTLKSVKSDVGPISEDMNLRQNSHCQYDTLPQNVCELSPEDTVLNFITKQVLDIFLIPKLNDLGKQGFPLPMTRDFSFQNTQLSMLEDALVLATDIKYTP